ITISELTASGCASVLIPSPNVAENHQYYNALTLKNAGAALLFEEKDIDEKTVCSDIISLMANKKRLAMMGVNARTLAIPDSAGRIYERIKKIIR
ncbi:MAG: glycosyltransferase, partial [Oscillospiraceae bacterium]